MIHLSKIRDPFCKCDSASAKVPIVFVEAACPGHPNCQQGIGARYSFVTPGGWNTHLQLQLLSARCFHTLALRLKGLRWIQCNGSDAPGFSSGPAPGLPLYIHYVYPGLHPCMRALDLGPTFMWHMCIYIYIHSILIYNFIQYMFIIIICKKCGTAIPQKHHPWGTWVPSSQQSTRPDLQVRFKELFGIRRMSE